MGYTIGVIWESRLLILIIVNILWTILLLIACYELFVDIFRINIVRWIVCFKLSLKIEILFIFVDTLITIIMWYFIATLFFVFWSFSFKVFFIHADIIMGKCFKYIFEFSISHMLALFIIIVGIHSIYNCMREILRFYF